MNYKYELFFYFNCKKSEKKQKSFFRFFPILIIISSFTFSRSLFASTMCWPVKATGTYCVHGGTSDNACSGTISGLDSDAAAIDLAASKGTSVFAPVTGTYTFVKSTYEGTADCSAKVNFQYNGNNYSLYLRHLDQASTNNGCDETNSLDLNQGALLGYVGGRKHIHLQTSSETASFGYTKGLIGKLFFTSEQIAANFVLKSNDSSNETINGIASNLCNSNENTPDTTVTSCSLDEGPAKGVASVCVGDCPLKNSEFCWPVKGNLGQFPFNPDGSHKDNDSFDINGNNGYSIYAPITGNYTFGASSNSGSLNNGMPGCYATVPFEYQGQQLVLRFVHMPYENGVSPDLLVVAVKLAHTAIKLAIKSALLIVLATALDLTYISAFTPPIQGTSRFPEIFFDGVAAIRANKEQLASIAESKLCENGGGGSSSPGTSNDCTTVAQGTLRIYTLDVPSGGNAAMIIKTDSTTIMIDGGVKEAATDVVNFLKNLGVTTINAYIMTHTDNDHVINIPEIFSNFTVQERYSLAVKNSITMDKYNGQYNLNAFISSNGYTNKALSVGQNLCSTDGLQLKVVGPSSSAPYFQRKCAVCMSGGYCGNLCSLNFLVTFGNTKALFTGDGILSQTNLLNNYGPELANLDVLQVPHHGLVSLTRNFVTSISPKYAFSASESNFYAGGGIWSGTLRNLNAAGTQIFYTKSGNLLFLSDGNSFQVIKNVNPSQYK